MAKNVTHGEETEEIPLVEEPVLEVPPVELAEPGVAAPAVKRALGVKEPIVFKWKVIGGSQGAIVTLFKSVEREEADAQADRLRKESYYEDVRVLEASAKVEQPAPKPTKKPSRPEAAAKPAPKSLDVGKKLVKAAATPVAKKAPPKVPAKPAVKSPLKKKTAPTATSKRPVKEKS